MDEEEQFRAKIRHDQIVGEEYLQVKNTSVRITITKSQVFIVSCKKKSVFIYRLPIEKSNYLRKGETSAILDISV
jgi:hypothetical protein